jgi:peptidoglycan glycosyltransferase
MRGRILDRNGEVLAETELGPDGTPRRVYEMDGAVHVLGFTSARVGGSGVEAVAADRLMGRTEPSPADTLRDILHQPRTGEDVALTIDARLQQVAVEAMGGALGAVVALDPRTGDVLAMVSNPTFSSDFSEEEWDSLRSDPDSPLLNRATQGLYAPGSTYKTVTLAAALEYGLVTLDTPVTCPDEVFIDGVRIINRNEPAGRRTETVADAYAYSCNTYFAQLGIEVGEERFRAMAEAFGLTVDIPFPLPTERGRLSTSPDFLDTGAGLAASAFGQGELQFSPLHLALVTAAIANDGVIATPRLFLDDDVTEWRRAISPETARALREAMEYGVEAGWASTVAIPGVRVGGKTGSAEVVVEESPHALFIAFAPVDDPGIVVVVVKERAGSGSREAGPVARRVIEAWLAFQEDAAPGTDSSGAANR